MESDHDVSVGNNDCYHLYAKRNIQSIVSQLNYKQVYSYYTMTHNWLHLILLAQKAFYILVSLSNIEQDMFHMSKIYSVLWQSNWVRCGKKWDRGIETK